MKIILGSTSIHKLNAVREACKQLDLKASVTGIKADSGQNEQPVELDETLQGALTRAESAKAHEQDSVAIGIESGIFRSNSDISITLEFAVIVVIPQEGRRIITTSTGIEFPEDCVRIAEEGGFETTTVGSVITRKFGGESNDPQSSLTGGRISRSKTLVEGLVVALLQL